MLLWVGLPINSYYLSHSTSGSAGVMKRNIRVAPVCRRGTVISAAHTSDTDAHTSFLWMQHDRFLSFPTSNSDNTAHLIRHEALRRCRLIWIELSIMREAKPCAFKKCTRSQRMRVFFDTEIMLSAFRVQSAIQELIDNATWHPTFWLFTFT